MDHNEKEAPVLRFFAGPFYAIWVFSDKICTHLADRSIHAVSYDQNGAVLEHEAMKLGYFSDTPTNAHADIFHYLTEKVILHSWVANRLHVRPSNYIWRGAHPDIEITPRFEQALDEENRIVKCVQASLNGLSWGVEHLSNLRMNGSLISDANWFFRNPDMTSAWRDKCLSGKHRVEPLLLPYGLSDKEPPDDQDAA